MTEFGFKKATLLGADPAALPFLIKLILAQKKLLILDSNKRSLESLATNLKSALRSLEESKQISTSLREMAYQSIQLSLDLDQVSEAEILFDNSNFSIDKKREIFNTYLAQDQKRFIVLLKLKDASLTQYSRGLDTPERLSAFHCLNLSSVRLEAVELVRSVQITRETILKSKNLLKELNLKYIIINEFPGLIFDRVLAVMINEAIISLHEGVASIDEIDDVFESSSLMSLGPLRYADMMGLDRLFDILTGLYEDLAHPKYIPCPLLKKYVEAGYLGQKTGRGFYKYDSKFQSLSDKLLKLKKE